MNGIWEKEKNFVSDRMTSFLKRKQYVTLEIGKHVKIFKKKFNEDTIF